MDSFACHIDKEIKRLLEESEIELLIIPDGTTSLL